MSKTEQAIPLGVCEMMLLNSNSSLKVRTHSENLGIPPILDFLACCELFDICPSGGVFQPCEKDFSRYSGSLFVQMEFPMNVFSYRGSVRKMRIYNVKEIQIFLTLPLLILKTLFLDTNTSYGINETFDNICNKDVGKTIVDLISKSTLSFQDIDRLEKILEMKKKDAVEEVPCTCVPGQCNCKEMKMNGNKNI